MFGRFNLVILVGIFLAINTAFAASACQNSQLVLKGVIVEEPKQYSKAIIQNCLSDTDIVYNIGDRLIADTYISDVKHNGVVLRTGEKTNFLNFNQQITGTTVGKENLHPAHSVFVAHLELWSNLYESDDYLKLENGLVGKQINKVSPTMQKMGLVEGDIIFALAGVPLRSMTTERYVSISTSRNLKVQILRDNAIMQISLRSITKK